VIAGTPTRRKGPDPARTRQRSGLSSRLIRAELCRSCISDKLIDGWCYQSVLRTGTDNRYMQMLKNNRSPAKPGSTADLDLSRVP